VWGGLVGVGRALLGAPEPRASLVLPLRRRVAVVLLASVPPGPVAARRPLTAERAARGWSATVEAAPAPALPEGAAARWSAARETTAAPPAPAATTAPAATARRGNRHRGDQHQDHDGPGGRVSCSAPHGWFPGFGTRNGTSCAPSAGVKVKTLSATAGARFKSLKFASYCGCPWASG